MEVVAGPQQNPPRVSLISSAELVPVNENDTKWQGGFTAKLDGHGGVNVFSVCPGDAETFDFEDYPGGVATFKPYVLYATDKSSTFGNDYTEMYDRAQRKLQAGESSALEAILWAGYSGATNENPFLGDGAGDYATTNVASGLACEGSLATSTISITASKVHEAFAVLEQKIGEVSASRGMVHIRPQAFHKLVELSVVRREGNVWLSPMDNIVVPGRGYPGTGPTGQVVGASEWMYGHPGIVQIRRGGIDRLGEKDLASQVNRYTNDHEVIVQRVAHVLLDPTAQVFAIEFDALT